MMRCFPASWTNKGGIHWSLVKYLSETFSSCWLPYYFGFFFCKNYSFSLHSAVWWQSQRLCTKSLHEWRNRNTIELLNIHTLMHKFEIEQAFFPEKPKGYRVLNLYWDVLRSQTHCNKAAIFKSSHKILVIFLFWTDSVLASHTAVFPSKAELERVTERPWV